jgi:ABC-type proline/glycine betaine transport system ATPase subunit
MTASTVPSSSNHLLLLVASCSISALDAHGRKKARMELKRIPCEAEQTLIHVTHDQAEAMSVADRRAILEPGPSAPCSGLMTTRLRPMWHGFREGLQ